MGYSGGKNPSGTIILKDKWNDSASGHVETSEKITLSVSSNDSVELLEVLTTERQMGPKSDSTSQKWVLPIASLIELIKTEGVKS